MIRTGEQEPDMSNQPKRRWRYHWREDAWRTHPAHHDPELLNRIPVTTKTLKARFIETWARQQKVSRSETLGHWFSEEKGNG